jgi:Zn-dependent protease with chaperone function
LKENKVFCSKKIRRFKMRKRLTPGRLLGTSWKNPKTMPGNGTASPDYSILAEFNGTIGRPKTGALYHACLFLVAGTMLALPLIYLAMVGLLAWATYHHAVYDWAPIMGFGGLAGGIQGIIIKFLIYAIPLFAGIVVLFFMFKPLLAKPPRRAQPLAMNPADNPLLYAFISKICDIVGAPAPNRIDMNCDLNASASFRRGFRSMTGNDLVLTIGLPLVANFSTRELAGVIAHEFGHFTQGAGMRVSYLIRSINFWFARVAYQRDAWDQSLENWANREQDIRVLMIVWSVQIAVWFSRLILKTLMLIGHIFAGFMLRQMEYDADAYQIQVVGSETFETTHRKLAALGAATEQTYKVIQARWKKTGQLPDNLSELIRQTHETLPPGILQKIDDTLGLDRTSLFDSHPSAANRIRRARMAGVPGIFHDERPASSLFASFEHPARFVTLLHYAEDLGIPITDKTLLRVESNQPKSAQGYLDTAPSKSAADEFFLGVVPLLVPLRIAPPIPNADYEADITELSQLSAGLQQITGQLAPMAEQYKEVSLKLLNARAALRLLEAGVPIQPDAFGLADATATAAQVAETEAAAAREALRHSLREISTALDRRIQLALAIRLSDKGESGPNFVPPERVQELVSELNQAADDYAKHEQALEALAVFNRIATMKSEGETPALSRAFEAQKRMVHSLTNEPSPEISNTTPQPGIRLARQQNHLSSGDLALLQQTHARWFSNYQKAVNQLAEIAHGAEKLSL